MLEEAYQLQSSVKRDKLCWSWKRVYRVRYGMEQRKDRRTYNSMRNQMEVQSARSISLWRSMGTVGEKLQESNVCGIGEKISHRGRSFNNDGYCWADFERKTLDSSQFGRKWLRSIDPQSLLAWQQERLLTLPTMRGGICWSSKTLLTNSSLCKSHMGQISERISANSEQPAKMAICGERNP